MQLHARLQEQLKQLMLDNSLLIQQHNELLLLKQEQKPGTGSAAQKQAGVNGVNGVNGHAHADLVVTDYHDARDQE